MLMRQKLRTKQRKDQCLRRKQGSGTEENLTEKKGSSASDKALKENKPKVAEGKPANP